MARSILHKNAHAHWLPTHKTFALEGYLARLLDGLGALDDSSEVLHTAPHEHFSRTQHCIHDPLVTSSFMIPSIPSRKIATDIVSQHFPRLPTSTMSHTRRCENTQKHPVQRRLRFRRSKANTITSTTRRIDILRTHNPHIADQLYELQHTANSSSQYNMCRGRHTWSHCRSPPDKLVAEQVLETQHTAYSSSPAWFVDVIPNFSAKRRDHK